MNYYFSVHYSLSSDIVLAVASARIALRLAAAQAAARNRGRQTRQIALCRAQNHLAFLFRRQGLAPQIIIILCETQGVPRAEIAAGRQAQAAAAHDR
jgi:hypothetical protein